METNNTLSKIYPILFIICPHLLVLWLISLSRFSWPVQVAVACAGVVSGIVAEILIVKDKISVGSYILELIAAVAVGIVLWILGYIIKTTVVGSLFGWGWWYKTWGIMLERALLFIPAVISSVFLAIKIRRPSSHAVALILIDPILQLAMLWYILDTLLSAMPT